MLNTIKATRLFSMVLFFCLIFPVTGYALSDEGQEVSPAEKQKIFEKLHELSKSTFAIIATVNQEKQLVMLKEKILVDGTVTMKKPDMFRWEMVRPAKSITVIDGEEMTVYTPESKEAQVYSLSDNTMARTTMKFFSTTMWGAITEMEKRFAVKTFRKDGEIVLKLTPLSKMVGKYLSSIIIYYDGDTGLPHGFEMITPKSDKTVTKLSNIKVNPDIKPDVFKLTLPEDVWVTNNSDRSRNGIE
ncbi:MAG TPA: outer membrane lipoprotein carrier protein LolA [Candidatus Brocadiaceae bacterium]|nr:outer membrane lipoprotein carrier protein LolA [Candidatus Brocadiaceae bacterium]